MSTRAERRRAHKQALKNRTAVRAPKMDEMKAAPQVERLVAVALIDAQGDVHHGGRSHYELRDRLGRSTPSAQDPSDTPGFWTSFDRFVDRSEAQVIGEEAGQCQPQRRELLSSDVDW